MFSAANIPDDVLSDDDPDDNSTNVLDKAVNQPMSIDWWIREVPFDFDNSGLVSLTACTPIEA